MAKDVNSPYARFINKEQGGLAYLTPQERELVSEQGFKEGLSLTLGLAVGGFAAFLTGGLGLIPSSVIGGGVGGATDALLNDDNVLEKTILGGLAGGIFGAAGKGISKLVSSKLAQNILNKAPTKAENSVVANTVGKVLSKEEVNYYIYTNCDTQ